MLWSHSLNTWKYIHTHFSQWDMKLYPLVGGIYNHVTWSSTPNGLDLYSSPTPINPCSNYLEVGTKISSDMRWVTLREDSDFLLDVFNLILCFFKVYNLHGNHFLWSIVKAGWGKDIKSYSIHNSRSQRSLSLHVRPPSICTCKGPLYTYMQGPPLYLHARAPLIPTCKGPLYTYMQGPPSYLHARPPLHKGPIKRNYNDVHSMWWCCNLKEFLWIMEEYHKSIIHFRLPHS